MSFDTFTIEKVSSRELNELMNGLKASGHGQVTETMPGSGSFVVSKKIGFLTLSAHGTYFLDEASNLVVSSEHADKVKQGLLEALASIRGKK